MFHARKSFRNPSRSCSLLFITSNHFVAKPNCYRVAGGPHQPVNEDGTPKQKRSESPTGGSGGTLEKKKDKPWPWDVKLGGCQNDISGLNVARAEAQGCLVKHIPEIVKQHCRFKRKSIHNPKQIICRRCKQGLWSIIQEGHMETLQQVSRSHRYPTTHCGFS